MPELSIVIPVYNEQEVLPILQRSLADFFTTYPMKREIIVVDDASTDRSREILEEWSNADPSLRIIYFEKNLGHQSALLEGMSRAEGNYIVTMDADLQDPLESIPEMMEKAREGYEIVHMQRISREGESLFRKSTAWTFYRISKLLRSNTLLDVGDFRLVSQKVAQIFRDRASGEVLLRKAITDIPVRNTTIQYHRRKRAAGISKFSIGKLFKLALTSGKLRRDQP